MQLFLEQQNQFRQQLGGMLGQTPWTMMNQMAERNLEAWTQFQKFMAGQAANAKPGDNSNDKPGGKR